jgi:hypothetical protein
VSTGIWVAVVMMNDPPPETYRPDLMLWLCIAWVFRVHATFPEVTATAIEHSFEETMRTTGLPIHLSVTEKVKSRTSVPWHYQSEEDMERRRCHGINDVRSYLQRRVQRNKGNGCRWLQFV